MCTHFELHTDSRFVSGHLQVRPNLLYVHPQKMHAWNWCPETICCACDISQLFHCCLVINLWCAQSIIIWHPTIWCNQVRIESQICAKQSFGKSQPVDWWRAVKNVSARSCKNGQEICRIYVCLSPHQTCIPTESVSICMTSGLCSQEFLQERVDSLCALARCGISTDTSPKRMTAGLVLERFQSNNFFICTSARSISVWTRSRPSLCARSLQHLNAIGFTCTTSQPLLARCWFLRLEAESLSDSGVQLRQTFAVRLNCSSVIGKLQKLVNSSTSQQDARALLRCLSSADSCWWAASTIILLFAWTVARALGSVRS